MLFYCTLKVMWSQASCAYCDEFYLGSVHSQQAHAPDDLVEVTSHIRFILICMNAIAPKDRVANALFIIASSIMEYAVTALAIIATAIDHMEVIIPLNETTSIHVLSSNDH